MGLASYKTSLDTNDSEGRYSPEMRELLKGPTEKEKLRRELEGDAAAIARLIHSSYTPDNLRTALLDELAQVQSGVDDEPEVLKVSYPLAIMMQREKEQQPSEAKD